MFKTLDLPDPARQIAYYDDGVGTSSFKLFAVLGGVFGFGLKRNVIDIYSFCCRNYKSGDRIYCFGFSRGAFTIRIVAGMIAYQGRSHTTTMKPISPASPPTPIVSTGAGSTAASSNISATAHIDLRGTRDRVILVATVSWPSERARR